MPARHPYTHDALPFLSLLGSKGLTFSTSDCEVRFSGVELGHCCSGARKKRKWVLYEWYGYLIPKYQRQDDSHDYHGSAIAQLQIKYGSGYIQDLGILSNHDENFIMMIIMKSSQPLLFPRVLLKTYLINQMFRAFLEDKKRKDWEPHTASSISARYLSRRTLGRRA